ncbi:DoxX family protein [Paenibacillus elgii]|uniref:DoxX family protein n=1 Tax=Paenibacillus elgii TaxID=189691 RepID=A0A2T6FXF0_9BACL|nr:DoxX family protein [Paenibacillus elgii]PUA36584.1 DoxX family protein [Paenibacillus elgii]
MDKLWKYAGWIGLCLVALIFIQAAVLKLMGVQAMVEVFNKLGYPAWFRIVIGILEIAGAIALLIRSSSRYGAILLALIMIGAMISSLVKGAAGDAIVPVIMLFLLVWIAVVRGPVNRYIAEQPPASKVR